MKYLIIALFIAISILNNLASKHYLKKEQLVEKYPIYTRFAKILTNKISKTGFFFRLYELNQRFSKIGSGLDKMSNSDYKDNTYDLDCSPKLLFTSSDLIKLKVEYPLKYSACMSLWNKNGGLPGAQLLVFYNSLDNQPNNRSCNKNEFDSMVNENSKFDTFLKQMTPKTYRFCQNLWRNQG